MWKNDKKTIIFTTIVTLLPIVAGVIFWDQLPEQLAIHFNAAGEPDGWASKAAAVLGLPAGLAALHLVLLFVTDKDPKRQNISNASKMLMLWVSPFISWLGMAMTIGFALEAVRNITSIVSVCLGILFMVIGNYLPKCLPSYTVGIKLPWTLHSDDNWRYTHRIGGFCFMAAGLITLIGGIGGFVWTAAPALILAAIVPTAASYLYYKKHGEDAQA